MLDKLKVLIHKVPIELRDVGVFGTLKLILHALYLLFTPSYRKDLMTFYETQQFDRAYGIDTVDVIKVHHLDVPSNKLAHSGDYVPSSMNIFSEIFSRLTLSFKEYVFVDFGSGKGLILLLASNFPFKKIIGVEFSPRMNEIARRNISIYKSESQKCFDLELICADAVEYPIPQENAILYFYNPFDDQVMSQVLKNVEVSISRSPRQIYIVYLNPVYKKLMDDCQFLEIVVEEKNVVKEKQYSVYKNKL